MKRIFNTISLSLTFLLILCALKAGAEGRNFEGADGDGPNWVQYSISKRILVPKGVDLNGEVLVVEGMYTINITIDTGLEWVRCCRSFHDKDAWCDISMQNKRC